MSGFSYGKNRALDEKCIEKKEWAGQKMSFMVDFYLRQALKGKTPEEIVDFLEYGISVYQGINQTSDEEMYKLARLIEDHFSLVADVLGVGIQTQTKG